MSVIALPLALVRCSVEMTAQAAMMSQPGERKPAPGALALVQAFVNTVDLEEGREALVSPEALRDRLVRCALLEPTATLTESDLDHALLVREALRDLLLVNSGGAPGAAAVATLNAAGAASPLLFRLDDGLQATAVPGSAGLNGALARLFAIILAAQVDGTWQRLKVCQNDICRWAFYDASKNQSGHWCTMAICGSRRKTRAYRARRRETGE